MTTIPMMGFTKSAATIAKASHAAPTTSSSPR